MKKQEKKPSGKTSTSLKRRVSEKKPATVKKAALAKNEKKDPIDLVGSLIDPTIKFIRTDFKTLFKRMLGLVIVHELSLLGIMLAFLVISIVALFGLGISINTLSLESFTSNSILLGLCALLVLLYVFASSWVSNVFRLIYPLFADEQLRGVKKYSIRDAFSLFLMPGLKYWLIGFVISFIALLLPILGIVGFALISRPLLAVLSIMLYVLWIFVFIVLYNFLVQFWGLGISVGRLSPMDALKASVHLVKSAPLGIIVFDFVLLLAGLLIASPFFIVGSVLDIISQFGSIFGVFAGPVAIAAIWVMFIVFLLLKAVLSIVQAAVKNSILLPYIISYWKEIRKN